MKEFLKSLIGKSNFRMIQKVRDTFQHVKSAFVMSKLMTMSSFRPASAKDIAELFILIVLNNGSIVKSRNSTRTLSKVIISTSSNVKSAKFLSLKS